MEFESEGLRYEFKISQADLDLAGLDLSQIAAVHTHPFRQLELRPASGLSELAHARSQPDADVGGHLPMLACRLWTTNRL